MRQARTAASAALILGLLAAAGCQTHPVQPPGYESPPIVRPIERSMAPAMTASSDGSLFTQTAGWSPWRDDTAHQVGDIVTVRIAVNNQAENNATTELDRESGMDVGIEALLGREVGFPGVGSGDPLSGTSAKQLIKGRTVSTFKGDGDTRRSGKMTADVSAVVSHVYPNGNLRIHGSQSLTINNETSILTVDGIIRPGDISASNVVMSDRIANARIEITGRGVVSDKQRPGILTRLVDWFWPI